MKMSVRECLKAAGEAVFFLGFLYISYIVIWYLGLILGG